MRRKKLLVAMALVLSAIGVTIALAMRSPLVELEFVGNTEPHIAPVGGLRVTPTRSMKWQTRRECSYILKERPNDAIGRAIKELDPASWRPFFHSKYLEMLGNEPREERRKLMTKLMLQDRDFEVFENPKSGVNIYVTSLYSWDQKPRCLHPLTPDMKLHPERYSVVYYELPESKFTYWLREQTLNTRLRLGI